MKTWNICAAKPLRCRSTERGGHRVGLVTLRQLIGEAPKCFALRGFFTAPVEAATPTVTPRGSRSDSIACHFTTHTGSLLPRNPDVRCCGPKRHRPEFGGEGPGMRGQKSLPPRMNGDARTNCRDGNSRHSSHSWLCPSRPTIHRDVLTCYMIPRATKLLIRRAVSTSPSTTASEYERPSVVSMP